MNPDPDSRKNARSGSGRKNPNPKHWRQNRFIATKLYPTAELIFIRYPTVLYCRKMVNPCLHWELKEYDATVNPLQQGFQHYSLWISPQNYKWQNGKDCKGKTMYPQSSLAQRVRQNFLVEGRLAILPSPPLPPPHIPSGAPTDRPNRYRDRV